MNDKRLKEILDKIDLNRQLKQIYDSKWHKIVNFLYNNTGLKIAKIAKSGSYPKHTEYRDSDLDVIFCTSPDYYLRYIQELIRDKAYDIFGRIANINIGNKAVHVDFINPNCDVDIVYLSQTQFDKECLEIKNIKSIEQLQRDSIKLAKYALDKAGIKKVKGYQVEKACIQFDYDSLSEYTLHNIKHFTGIIREYGLTLDDVLKHLA